MNQSDLSYMMLSSGLMFAAVFIFVRYGWVAVRTWLGREEERFDRVLNHQLLLEVPPRTAMIITGCGMVACGLVMMLILKGSVIGALVGLAVGAFLPAVVIRHLDQRRRKRLELQLVDGIVTLASGVRAGLTLVQAMELLVTNAVGPIKQEFAQLLREYQMGVDLNQAMRNAANRIGSSNYRLLFTAVEMHRQRGGDTGESLDRIAESIREIQRLEGKLDALTAQGRTQARLMAMMPLFILGVYYIIDPQGVTMLFVDPWGRVLLLFAAALVLVGFLWIRKIMTIDI
jgi:tight adherence protein B